MISFQNEGLIDPRCITTIGVSVKDNTNPIGYFGTGLKYAIAIILRNGGKITIWRGLEPLRFDASSANIRGQDFQIVRMNGQDLGFTTELGKNWAIWQAFRELHCNAKDEGGKTVAGEVAPSQESTTIHVDMEAMLECYYDRAKYLLETEPIYVGPYVSFHPGPSSGVFYRSIMVGRVSDKPHLFTPNIVSKTTLTEDRTLADIWSVRGQFAHAILQSDDEAFIERFVTAPEGYAEAEMDLDWPMEPSAAFMKTVGNLLRDSSRKINQSAKRVYEKRLPAPDLVAAELLPHEEKKLAEAIAFCHALRFPVDEFPILIVESLGEHILGLACIKTRRIRLARRAIQLGETFLASTLIEEWTHIKHGFDDCSREMQNWLFEQMITFGSAYLSELSLQEREAA